jgi:hypothetical protein
MFSEEEDNDSEGLPLVQPTLENCITMNKMKLLKAKMEDMNINKKVDRFDFLIIFIGCNSFLAINTVSKEVKVHLCCPKHFIGKVPNSILNLKLQNASPLVTASCVTQ